MDKTVPVSIRMPKTLRTNIQQEADYNLDNNGAFNSFSAVVVRRLKAEKQLKPVIISGKERTILRSITIPASLHKEITKEAEANRIALNGHRYFSSVFIHRLTLVPLFVKPKE